MRKLTSIIIAAFAAASMTVSGYAQEFETEKPAIVFIGNVDTVNDSETDIVFDEASEDNRLFLENTDLPEDSEQPADSGKSFTAQDILKMAGISALIGVIIALVVCLIMKSRMKTAVPKITANDYIRKNSFNITRSRDIFIYANVTKKKRQKQENK
ncbi:MAG: hypothetical protein SPD47_07660 [Oscillospiraceae bacterium]|nr:hypothetical protein [Oscillospiraceae bacterium]